MSSNYTKRMSHLAKRIFGEVTRPQTPGRDRIVRIFSQKPAHVNPEVTDYYPKLHNVNGLMKVLRSHGLYRDEHQDLVDELKKVRILRGKVKPKKGEGKRSQRRQ